MAGIDTATREQLMSITGFQVGVMPFRYLGIPIASQKLKISDYSTLLDRLTQKINSWPKATLSYAGKAQLISSVLQGVECYWMSILPLPQGVIDRIYTICRSFMWTTKTPPIAWSEIVRPRQEGGLGLRDLRPWNLALLAKVLWRLQDRQDTLWLRWVHHTYLQQVGIWDWQMKHTDSPLIKQLVQIKDSIRATAGSVEASRTVLSEWFTQRKGGVGRAYDFFRDSRPRLPWVRTVWQKYIQPSHAFTVWLLAHGRLSVRARQDYMEDRLCTFCRQAEETLDHVFFRCTPVSQLWGRIRGWLHMQAQMSTYRRMLRVFRQHYRGTSVLTRARHLAMSAMVHHIWLARNRSMFEGVRWDGELVFRRIQVHVYRTLEVYSDQVIRQS